jgi:hypothetical protein
MCGFVFAGINSQEIIFRLPFNLFPEKLCQVHEVCKMFMTPKSACLYRTTAVGGFSILCQ